MTAEAEDAPEGDESQSLQPDGAIPSDVESVDSVLQARAIPEEIRTVVQAVLMEFHSGPLPPPRMLAQYNEVIPGLADRLVSMAEAQTTHRIDIERKSIEGDVRRADLGLVAGVVVSLAGLGAATVMAVVGQPWAAGSVAVLDIGTIAGIFVYGTQSRRSERTEKAEAVARQRQAQRRQQG